MGIVPTLFNFENLWHNILYHRLFICKLFIVIIFNAFMAIFHINFEVEKLCTGYFYNIFLLLIYFRYE